MSGVSRPCPVDSWGVAVRLLSTYRGPFQAAADHELSLLVVQPGVGAAARGASAKHNVALTYWWEAAMPCAAAVFSIVESRSCWVGPRLTPSNPRPSAGARVLRKKTGRWLLEALVILKPTV